jgi:hypothetical protein
MVGSREHHAEHAMVLHAGEIGGPKYIATRISHQDRELLVARALHRCQHLLLARHGRPILLGHHRLLRHRTIFPLFLIRGRNDRVVPGIVRRAAKQNSRAQRRDAAHRD